VFNSCSALITLDIYKKWKPGTGEKQLVMVGRIATAVLVLFGLAWIPVMRKLGQIYVYLQSVQAYISPPIAAVFLLGVFFKRLNARGAMAALLTGLALGMGRLYLEVVAESLGGPLHEYATVNFLHFAAFLFVACSAILVVVSLSSPAPSEAKLADLTYGTTTGASASDPGWRRLDVILSVVLAGIVGMVWLYFSG